MSSKVRNVSCFGDLKYELMCQYITAKTHKNIDPKMDNVCEAYNQIPNIRTVACCQGHKSTSSKRGVYPYILFAIDGMDDSLKRAFYGLDMILSHIDPKCGVTIEVCSDSILFPNDIKLSMVQDYTCTLINITSFYRFEMKVFELVLDILEHTFTVESNQLDFFGKLGDTLECEDKVHAGISVNVKSFRGSDLIYTLNESISALQSDLPLKYNKHTELHLSNIRNILEHNLWTKKGTPNKRFVSMLKKRCKCITLEFEDDHDLYQCVANVYIDGLPEIKMIGKKGSC